MKTRAWLVASCIALCSLLTPVCAFAVFEFPVCSAPGWQYAPAICGDIVVWEDSRNMETSGWDIYGYNLATRKEFPICTAPGNQQAPAIDGKLVVWQDERAAQASGSDIYARNLETAQEFAVCTKPGNQTRPAVSGTLVIWEDWRGFDKTGPDIYGYDLAIGEELLVSTAPASQRSPDVSNHIAVWEDWRRGSGQNSNSDIFRSRIRTQTASAGLAETPSPSPAPTVYDIGVSTKQGAATVVTLGPDQVSGRKLTYTVIMGPAHGKLRGTGPTRVYVPPTYYNGVDEFWFKANDGTHDSNVALVSIAVTPVNHPPVAKSQYVLVLKGSACEIGLQADDPDGHPLSYHVIQAPRHGKLYGQGRILAYEPADDYVGPDAIVFRVSDGALGSNQATISIAVREQNTTPEAASQEIALRSGARQRLVLVATDADGDKLTYTIAAPPAHGTLEGPVETGCVTYVSEHGYTGVDRFAFAASDGVSQSNPATVSIRVVPPSDG